jgi:large subunit ribosomal protein L22
MPVQAIAKGVRISPRKLAPVAALVRGRTVDDALVILAHTPRRAALAVRKTIESARANADYNHNYLPASLRITEIRVTPSVRYKRHRLVSRGAAHQYQHRTSHIRVVVDGTIRQPKKPVKKTVATKEKK